MTPKEKAKELFDKFDENFDYHPSADGYASARNGALIVVDEVLAAHFMKRDSGFKDFWLMVKNEIQKLSNENR